MFRWLLLIPKILELKAIHNVLSPLRTLYALLLIPKILEMKAIHNFQAWHLIRYSLLLIPKILEMKAIHNELGEGYSGLYVVTDPKDTGNESNSQRVTKNKEIWNSCY